jgi:hypothetical protein
MDLYEDPDLFVIDDDELIQLAGESANRDANAPQPRQRSPLHLPGQQPYQAPPPRTRPRRNERSTQTQTDPSVIDLTAEPDSPVRERRSTASASHGSRNPRRTNSQRISPPRLARSDSTFFTPVTGVIDLTADSPEESRPSNSTRSRSGRHHHPRHHSIRPNPDELIELEIISSVSRQEPNFTLLSRRFAGVFGPIIGFPPQLDISRPAFTPRPPSPKPPMEPVPPTREGFTRDTCADPEKASDNVVICPACEEELAYDPSDTVTHTSPSGGRKRKRAPGEHHFWALKKCGHVRIILMPDFLRL